MQLCGFEVGDDQPLFVISGPCVIESESMAMETATQLKEIAVSLDIPFIYKSSFDKANRSSLDSYRGPGISEGLRMLEKVRGELELPVLTDVHKIRLLMKSPTWLMCYRPRRFYLVKPTSSSMCAHRGSRSISRKGSF